MYGIKSLLLMKSKITSFLDGVIFAFFQIKPLAQANNKKALLRLKI